MNQPIGAGKGKAFKIFMDFQDSIPFKEKSTDEANQKNKSDTSTKQKEEKKMNDYTEIVRFEEKDSQFREAETKIKKKLLEINNLKMRVRLIAKCPGCDEKNKPTQWIHRLCETGVFIEETGYLSCDKTTCKKFFIRNAKFFCNKDHGVEYTQSKELSDLIQIIMHGVDSIKTDTFIDQHRMGQFILKLMEGLTANWDQSEI